MTPSSERLWSEVASVADATPAERQTPASMSAEDVKAALRVRHSATQHMGVRIVPGGWTVIEELYGIDVVAFSAHSSPRPSIGVPYPRVGYEVKVSRSDLRRELLRPYKRRRSVEWCNAFYFAVPRGILTADELAFKEPPWAETDFNREPCPERECYTGKRQQPFIGPLVGEYRYRWSEDVRCESCDGKGYAAVSRVEAEAPTLWVPRDVGLVVVDGRGCRVEKRAPTRQDVPDVEAGGRLNDLIRWVSARPDPRHHGLLERASERRNGVMSDDDAPSPTESRVGAAEATGT